MLSTDNRKYHWGFLIGPKVENDGAVPGARYHVKNSAFGWKYEENALGNVRWTNNLLARILIAKTEDEQRLITLLRSLPVVQNDPDWRCRSWIANALEQIAKDDTCVGTAELEWLKIERFARDYVGKKTANGRYGVGADMTRPKPTWDMIENVESESWMEVLLHDSPQKQCYSPYHLCRISSILKSSGHGGSMNLTS